MIDHSACTSRPALERTESQLPKPSAQARRMRAFIVCLAWTLALAFGASAQELSSDTVRLRLGVTSEGIPIIKEAVWVATGEVAFRDLGTPDGLSAWVPTSLIPATAGEPAAWSITDTENLTTAEAT